MINEDDILESKKLIPCITEEEYEKNYKDSNSGELTLYYNKPQNFQEMVECKDDEGNDIPYEILDLEIKFTLNDVKPINIFYKVNKSPILDQLKEICK